MKLLKKPKTQATIIQEENTKLIEKGQKIAEMVDTNEKRLNNTKYELEWKMGKFQEEYDAFMSGLSEGKQQFIDELSMLVSKKKEVMTSMDDLMGKLLFERAMFESLKASSMDEMQKEQSSLASKMAQLMSLMDQFSAILKKSEHEKECLLNLDKVVQYKMTELGQKEVAIDEKIEHLEGLLKECKEALLEREHSIKEKEQAQEVLWEALQNEKAQLGQDRLKFLDQQTALKSDFDYLRSRNLL